MRFKDFILESDDVKSVLAKYSKAITSGINLYRGIDEPYGAQIEGIKDLLLFEVSSRESSRDSRSGNQRIMQTVSKWKNVPRRSMSTSVTQSIETTEIFGSPVIIFPANNIKLFARTEEDFNEHELQVSQPREHITSMMKDANDLLDTAQIYQHILDVDLTGDERSDIKNILSKKELIAQAIKSTDARTFEQRILLKSFLDSMVALQRRMSSNSVDSVDELFDSITPEIFGVKTYTNINQIPVEETADEIWFEGDFLMMDIDGEDPQEFKEKLQGYL